MLVFILLLVLAGLAFLGIGLQKSYGHVGRKELRRRARRADPLAMVFYRVVAYGMSLRMFLWLLVGISSAAFFVVLSRSVSSVWLALFWSLLLIAIGFMWLPYRPVSKFSLRVAKRLTPVIANILHYAHPILDYIGSFIRRHRQVHIHTGLYQKEDLIELINQQAAQADNRISKEELQLARHALTFGNKLVRDYMTPRRVVRMVAATDTIGPVLMGELHNSGHSRFPVYQDKPEHLVGTLYLRDLIDVASGGRVRDVMKKEVYYIHEEQPLYDALQAFLKTKHHLFIVVNSFEEYVGIITVEDVLEQIIGRPIVDEFDQYDDLRSVATRQAAAEHRQGKHSAQ